MFSDGARSESRAFGRRGGRPSRGGKCGHRDDAPPTVLALRRTTRRSSLPRWEMRTSRRCPSNSAGIEADDAEVVPPAAGNADIETMSLQQKCSLCFVPSVYPRLISFATLTAGLRSIYALSCFVSPQPSSLFFHLPRGPPVQSPFASLRANLRFTICALSCFVTPHPPLIRRAIQITRFLAAVVGGFLGDRVELHRLAVERFPLTAGAAPRFGGNIRSEGKLTL